jgi:hypothetical protein
MKRTIAIILFVFSAVASWSQITITATDMPVSGDKLRYSIALPTTTTINLADSGTSFNWSYTLAPAQQAVDTYRTAAAVNIVYGFTIGPAAYGYKVADSFPGAPIPIKQLYTFFEKKTSPSRYEAEAFAANISGVPTPANYSQPDVWYHFPLNFHDNDSVDYSLTFSLATIGGMKQAGYRKSRVDGWGTITTPYYTTPVSCLRVRSEIHEIDTISFGATKFGIPRNSVEYKWLTNASHYPALWVTANVVGGTETVNSIRYEDSVRDLTPPPPVAIPAPTVSNIIVTEAFPNPSANGAVTITLPADWKRFDVAIYNMASQVVAQFKDERMLSLGALPAGEYVAVVSCGEQTAFARIVR